MTSASRSSGFTSAGAAWIADRFNLEQLKQFTNGWTGAEIEQCVVSALTKARLADREVTEQDLMNVAVKHRPAVADHEGADQPHSQLGVRARRARVPASGWKIGMSGPIHYNLDKSLPSLDSSAASDILKWAIATHGDSFAIGTSFQKEGMVMVDMASRISPDVRVFTLDTGRLPEETHQMIHTVRERYGIAVEVVSPDPAEVERMVSEHGRNLFYESVENRRLCCEIRKVRPLAAQAARTAGLGHRPAPRAVGNARGSCPKWRRSMAGCASARWRIGPPRR